MSVYSRLIAFIRDHEGEEWFSPREFAQKYGFNYHTVRKYLEELSQAGYLESKKEGKYVFYRLINPHKLSEKEQELAQKESLRWFSYQFKNLAENFRQIRHELKQRIQLLEEENEELRSQIERLRSENRQLKLKLTNYEDLLRTTPEVPISTVNKGKKMSRIELITELLHQKFCTKNLIKVKNEPEPEF